MEIGLAVGGAFLSSALNVLFDRLAPRGELLKMFQRGKHDVQLLEKLRLTLLGLQAVLSDAENKQASNRYVNQWLNELRDAVDSAESLMEEINYEVLRVKVESQHQNYAETSNQQVSGLNLCLSDEFFLSIKQKLEKTIKTLEELQNQIGCLDLTKNLVLDKQETRVPTTSLVDESDILGRQNEIAILVDHLLSVDADGKTYSVIPIVGMAGVGKTTLAKIVYHSEKLKDHFDLKAWFCVSEPYDASRITKGLLEEIGSSNLMVENNVNQLQIKLKESIKGKKCLIVLDDIWNDNYIEWDDLRIPFAQGEIGSKIIVTTRKESVAKTMGNEQISMDTLSSDVSWSLFKRHAFDNMDPNEHPELEEVGKQIAAKCKGLPLALKTLAGLLRSKSEIEEWRHILRSEIWELPDNDILPALMLSYNDLPSENMADRSEVLKANLRGKEHIEKLSLEWSVSTADSSQNERDILGELHPNPNIKELEINGYRGTNFPNWLADHSFSELVELSLSNCNDCYSLPALGQLPSLKFLTIRGMHRITEVTDEFYGSSSSKKPFNSLERLEFYEMLEWKQWHVLGNGEEFPTLQDLSIVNCPRLIGKLPENLCSLTSLRISYCPELNLETPIQLSSLKRFEVEGVLTYCEEVIATMKQRKHLQIGMN
ncbi:putative disease resistance rpp13-like protein 1 [Nicotiana attenuata]|uniref:Disease resistance rpp13-like protein 1 n=1 Tax=Nicotiana attenuata TaxID=49451 RepID=A0A1J6J7V6_NICAT|nr:putative disease resistance rpp13-like protein 1 [Nicotiana attenuata]